MGLNYFIGNAIQKIGYTVVRNDRIPTGTLNIAQLAIKALMTNPSKNKIHTIVQIGAYDGRFEDALQPILRSSIPFQATLVEPQPKPFADAAATYASDDRVKVVNAAIAEADGPISLYTNSTQHTPFATLLSSRKQLISQATKIQARGMTFATLLREGGISQIDFLMIDTEGYDLIILRQAMMVLEVLPAVIQLESYHLSRADRIALRNLLTKNGYQHIDSGHDTIALKPLSE